jgi:putative solute:sodium symporter small subunit
MPTTTATHAPGARGVARGELTEQQKQEYWRYNVRLTTILLAIWFVVTFLISGIWAGYLNQWTIIGFPLGYYMAAQGSLAIFVIEIAIYAWLMNKKDEEYGIREEG